MNQRTTTTKNAKIKKNFRSGRWSRRIDIQDFINLNYTPYEGDSSFLSGPTDRTKKIWSKVKRLMAREQQKGGVLDIDTSVPSSITSHKPGFIDKENEIIVGLQTDKPLKRAVKPMGGINLVEKACKHYGYTLDTKISEIYKKYRKTHNDAVFSVYTDEMKLLRKSGLLTGLPDSYARGRIIGDYRRIALYGTNYLIDEKNKDLQNINGEINSKTSRLREDVSAQINALEEIIILGKSYDCDLSRPAKNAREAIQWTYLAYLAAAKESDGAAMSIGNLSSFFDCFIEQDMAEGILNESEAQELIDEFTIKLRLIRQLRPPQYNELFAGDPVWITLVLGGMGCDGRTKVTKTDFRFLRTLENLGSAPEPNLTILYSPRLPQGWKDYMTHISIISSSIQYENDDLMRPLAGDDYGISCCVSLLKSGSQMQYFGARCNLAKVLLLAINEGRDEKTGAIIINGIPKLKKKVLDYDEVFSNFSIVLSWLAEKYVNTMNLIHWCHDKYYYEAAQMALLDTNLERLMAFGVAGFSVVVDSLCAIRYAKVKVNRNEQGLSESFSITGDFPAFGNDDERADNRGRDLIFSVITELRKHKTYRNAIPTLSLLTITSNVLYGKKTGATPDGRKDGEPFAPGANPMFGREKKGVLASMNSISKLPYHAAQDGISYTFSIVPAALGSGNHARINNLQRLLEGFFLRGSHHINVNVLDASLLREAMDHPEKYPHLTIRVSGYAVHFTKLSREHQEEVLRRTFHEAV